jgi:hypothetical protein
MMRTCSIIDADIAARWHTDVGGSKAVYLLLKLIRKDVP